MGVIRLVMEHEQREEKILTVSKVRCVCASNFGNSFASCRPLRPTATVGGGWGGGVGCTWGKAACSSSSFSALLLMLFLRPSDEVRLQGETERGMGLIQGLLGGEGINQNRLFTEVTLKRGAAETVMEGER